MSPTSRRIFLYWLLLLVPTLVVGAGAIHLLRREQARLAERGAYADEARRAAVAARARLIAENVELLVGDVQAGLLDTLAAAPVADLDAFLENWSRTNPLVRAAFRATPEGELLWPDGRTSGGETDGFRRRFARQFGSRPPWSDTPPAPAADAPEKREGEQLLDEASARRKVAANVAQVQSARRDVQELFKSQNAPASVSGASSGQSSPWSERADAASLRVGSRQVQTETDQRGAVADSSSLAGARPAATSRPQAPRAESKVIPSAQKEVERARAVAPERRGWTPAVIDGRLHVLGWVQPGGAGEVRGVEVELAALIDRMSGALPVEPGADEGYALRDEQGRVLHQAGAVGRAGEPVIRLPLAAAQLPGWVVTGYLTSLPADSISGGGFFWVGVVLVGIFIAAILAGGSLLLWQARRSEEEATQKTSFVANVSHEFKTPLTTIRLYSELLEQGRVRNQEQAAGYLRTIGRETQRLARLVNNALDFSRLEQGRKTFAREPVDLTAEIARLLDTHTPRVVDAGLALHRELQPAVTMTTDRDAIEQIVLNLIDNACKYAAAGGEVTVTLAARPGGGVEIRVADRGPGVPFAHRARIFEKFHRVDDALTAEKTGAGLGLSIARQLARGLGGELRYAARPGKGAEFVLELP